ncbi:Glycosyltransferase involved in cell wall bisynthesis [Modicisalibacter ilicicola DSM 19980]|uniref:Glycosyltransferase involved in cell wall bisynthesis n=1 Tax=Modicisalibacter ilicicola DSM 19980 TaxID=1121942 RepID=A0A1M5C007_9GAMM|nr:glycosyltransferase family 4 protein [Halomonas ilicicola]SHF48069.1 Glycosyltransferase involved in cell wall bisynthesis [Halomonas ilicicola DSM 19980]
MDVLFVAGNARSLIANRGDLIREMQDSGMEVAAAVPTRDYLPEVRALGITVFPFDMGRTGINPISDLRALVILARLMMQHKPKAVFSYTIKPVIYGSIAARLAQVPRVYSMVTGLGHVFTTSSLRTRIIRLLVTRLYRLGVSCSDVIFFQNPDDENDFTRLGIVRDRRKIVRVNGSGVDTRLFAREPLPRDAPVFLFIGRMLTEKGIAEFVEAATSVKKRHPEARFIAVGPHDASLPHAVKRAQLEQWKSEDVVEFVDGVKDVRPWLAKCSVFVLPSYREGTPRSVLEAMSVGRAIITSDAPGCRETVVDGSNGFLVPPKATKPLAAAMTRFLESPELMTTMGEASRRIAEEKYDVRKVNRVIMGAMKGNEKSIKAPV